jgi:hypothetical protein
MLASTLLKNEDVSPAVQSFRIMSKASLHEQITSPLHNTILHEQITSPL